MRNGILIKPRFNKQKMWFFQQFVWLSFQAYRTFIRVAKSTACQ